MIWRQRGGYAEKIGIPMATLQNKEGAFIAPTPESGSATLANIELPANLRAFDFNPGGKDSYPIVTFTWWLVHPKYADAAMADAIKKLADWCLTTGQGMSAELGYLPLPDNVVAKVKASADPIK